MNIDPTQLREFAKSYTAAWCSGDAARVAAHYLPEGWIRINDGEASKGRSAIAGSAQEFMTTFPDLQVAMDDLVMTSDGAEFHWTLTGTHTGPGGSGNRVRISGVEVWKIAEEGLIAESQGHFDAADYQRQLAGTV
jgi:predicted ester cyclase